MTQRLKEACQGFHGGTCIGTRVEVHAEMKELNHGLVLGGATYTRPAQSGVPTSAEPPGEGWWCVVSVRFADRY